jgi:HK97 family phage major capsid protein
MKLHELLEKRAAKIADMRRIQTTADESTRDLNDNERTAFDALENEVRSLTTQVERAQRLDALERTAAATPINGEPAKALRPWRHRSPVPPTSASS